MQFHNDEKFYVFEYCSMTITRLLECSNTCGFHATENGEIMHAAACSIFTDISVKRGSVSCDDIVLRCQSLYADFVGSMSDYVSQKRDENSALLFAKVGTMYSREELRQTDKDLARIAALLRTSNYHDFPHQLRDYVKSASVHAGDFKMFVEQAKINLENFQPNQRDKNRDNAWAASRDKYCETMMRASQIIEGLMQHPRYYDTAADLAEDLQDVETRRAYSNMPRYLSFGNFQAEMQSILSAAISTSIFAQHYEKNRAKILADIYTAIASTNF